MFHNESENGKAVILKFLGQYDDACNVPLNIISNSSDPNVQLISNLAFAPFTLFEKQYASVEGFWQGLKFPDEKKRREIAILHGKEARKAGKEQEKAESFEFEDRIVKTASPEHRKLMKLACYKKFSQNKNAQEALLSTGERTLEHKTRRDSLTIPNAIMADFWMKVRAIIRREVSD